MLQITIPAPESEDWDEENEEFIYHTVGKSYVLQLEHSLVSISKWESKWCKPFFSKDKKTEEEENDYVRCMTITQNVDPNVYKFIPNDIRDKIREYINAPMTATWFNDNKTAKNSSEQITSELVYYWMISQNIPVKFEKWHLNRLLTLIRVCDIKSQPSKKMSEKAIMSRNTALNAARRKQLNTRG